MPKRTRISSARFSGCKGIKNCQMNKKIIIFLREDSAIGSRELCGIIEGVSSGSGEWYVNKAFAEKARAEAGIEIPEVRQYVYPTAEMTRDAVILSCGGDGTFLEAVRYAYEYGIPIAGVNYGHLGFLSNAPRESMSEIVQKLRSGEFTVQPRTMLHVEDSSGTITDHPYALNEFTICRSEINMTYIDVYVGPERLATYRGDGVLVSTPTGSTAYSLSVGGPIVDPLCNCLIVAPVAPHNLAVRPVVIPDTSVVTLRASSRADNMSASLDNRTFTVPCETVFTLRKAEKPVFLINLQNISFYDTLRNKMMWGLNSWDSSLQ